MVKNRFIFTYCKGLDKNDSIIQYYTRTIFKLTKLFWSNLKFTVNYGNLKLF